MSNYQICDKLRNIPQSKLIFKKNQIMESCDICSINKKISCDKCMIKSKLINRYFEANIPIDFWSRTTKDFVGDVSLLNIYNEFINDINGFFDNGKSYFLKGRHGTGKTFISSLFLKKISEKGYSGLYTTLVDIITAAVQANYIDRFNSLRELKMVDFLVIDEFDPRFFSNDNSAELYGRILESILRIRLQNKMPTILITNHPDPTKSLGDALSLSISSLIAGYVQEVAVIGKDARYDEKRKDDATKREFRL